MFVHSFVIVRNISSLAKDTTLLCAAVDFVVMSSVSMKKKAPLCLTVANSMILGFHRIYTHRVLPLSQAQAIAITAPPSGSTSLCIIYHQHTPDKQ